MENAYRVVIISGSGSEMSFDIVTLDNCSDDSCSYIFSSDSITDSYSVAVEVVGCITERINCINFSSCTNNDFKSLTTIILSCGCYFYIPGLRHTCIICSDIPASTKNSC